MSIASKRPQDNDFTVKIGNVNGTGSASANSMLMKSLFRMGIPVCGKNYFPSNIQGLPTWYEIRVSAEGHLARSGRVDVMVAMNAETYRKDHAEVAPGGYLIYDSTWPRSQLFNRADIHILGVPLSRICNENFDKARSRILMKNIMYVGVLAALLDLDMNVIKQLLNEQFAAKASLLDANQKAIDLGYAYAKENFSCPLPFRARTLDKTRDHIMIDGNTTAGLGCLFAGATVGAWYPITPSTSLMDAFKRFCEKYRKDPETGKSNVLHHPGGRRAWRHRHGAGRQLERRALLHAHQRSGHLADERVPGLRLLHRDSRRALRRAALRAVHRHADAHPAGRPHGLRLRLPWRHAARAAVPRQPGRGLLSRGRRPSTWPSGCRRRSSSSPTSTSA